MKTAYEYKVAHMYRAASGIIDHDYWIECNKLIAEFQRVVGETHEGSVSAAVAEDDFWAEIKRAKLNGDYADFA